MAEHLDVRWPRPRWWLESARTAAGQIEQVYREIAYVTAERDEAVRWGAGGGSSSHGPMPSDPTAREAQRRVEGLEDALRTARETLADLQGVVGRCLAALDAMSRALSSRHAEALELYYVDRAPTWSDVASEMGIGRSTLFRLRDQAYAWLEECWVLA